MILFVPWEIFVGYFVFMIVFGIIAWSIIGIIKLIKEVKNGINN